MVNIKTDKIYGMLNELSSVKRLICFGTGNHFDAVMQQYQSWNLQDCQR